MRHQLYYAETHKVKLEDGIKVWLETCKKPDLKPSSYDRIESTLNCQIIPRIRWRYITDLSDSIIQSVVYLSERRSVPGSRKLNPRKNKKMTE